jgi:hypothetical protein
MTATVDILHPDRPKRGAHRGVEPDGNDRDRPARRVRVGRAHLVEATIPRPAAVLRSRRRPDDHGARDVTSGP